MADSELLAYRIAVSGAVVALMGILADRILLGLIDFAKSYGKHLLQWIIVGLGALGTLVLFAYITVFIAIELAEVAL